VVIAVGAMGMVQVAVDQIIDMIPMRNGFVTAPRPVDVVLEVSPDFAIPRAFGRVFGIHFDHVLLDAIPLLVFQMTGLEIIRVPVVLNGDVAAAGPVVMFFCNAHISFR
jgi:hypothetical protein